jgi:hypothetical protein
MVLAKQSGWCFTVKNLAAALKLNQDLPPGTKVVLLLDA